MRQQYGGYYDPVRLRTGDVYVAAILQLLALRSVREPATKLIADAREIIPFDYSL